MEHADKLVEGSLSGTALGMDFYEGRILGPAVRGRAVGSLLKGVDDARPCGVTIAPWTPGAPPIAFSELQVLLMAFSGSQVATMAFSVQRLPG